MAAFLPKFQFSSGVRPSGEVSRLITAATNFKLPEVEWTLVFTAIERINAHPAEGSSEAVKTIKYSLEATDPVAINYTLSVLDVLLKNCVTEFSAECTTKDSRKYFHRFLERKDLAAENRGKLLEILADAGTGSTSHPEFRKFLEALIAAGFKFSDASLSKLSPAELERLKPARTTTSSVKSRVTYLDSQKETLPTYSNALNADISSVTHRERAEWVHFDCNLAAGCAGMLFDTVEDAHSSIDLTHNVVVKEAAARCKQISDRLSQLLIRVHEPELSEQLQTSREAVNTALSHYDAVRLARDPHADEAVTAPAPQSPRATASQVRSPKLKSSLMDKVDVGALSPSLKPIDFKGVGDKIGGLHIGDSVGDVVSNLKVKGRGHKSPGAGDPFGESAGLLNEDYDPEE